jgi:hypothetical protein
MRPSQSYRGQSYRGQPLVAFLLLLGGWVAIRAMVWDAGGGLPLPQERMGPVRQAEARTAPLPPMSVPDPATPEARDTASPLAPMPPSFDRPDEPFPPQPAHPAGPPVPRWSPGPRWSPPPTLPPAAWQGSRPTAMAAPAPAHLPAPTNLIAGHQLLWMAALSNLPLPQGLVAHTAELTPLADRRPAASSAPAPASISAPPPPPPPVAAFRDSRWSADAWLLLRRGGTVPAAGGLTPATYGASQSGGVVRYRLAPTNRHRPTLYMRGTAALNGSREREAAVGASARPIAGVPVVAAVEVRANNQPGGTSARPAAFAYTELPPVALPGDARAEVYAQAGYVGGNFASAFADGQLRIDRKVRQLGRGELRAGGGVWGGAQKGASRLDLGPSATMAVPLGDRAGARLGVDWRFRVAGDAAPSSGPAVTLSAGF